MGEHIQMNPPAFQFYAADFLADENVVLMNNQAVGCYIKLMCYCWREGSIPSDIPSISRLCGETDVSMAQLWLAITPCFTSAITGPSRLIHPRLEKEREKQEGHRKERAESGSKGGKARWANELKAHSLAQAQVSGAAIANDGSSSSSSSSSSIKNNVAVATSSEWDFIYQAYPRKVGKAAAQKAIAKAITLIRFRGESNPAEWLLAKVKQFAQSPAGKAGEFCPHPATWFNQARYDDDQKEWDRQDGGANQGQRLERHYLSAKDVLNER
jgi:hypothetical protein